MQDSPVIILSGRWVGHSVSTPSRGRLCHHACNSTGGLPSLLWWRLFPQVEVWN